MAFKFRQIRRLDDMLKSAALGDILQNLGERVLAEASTDPNQTYVDGLEMQFYETRDRLRVQVGAEPGLGMAVEAKRGTLARALASIGNPSAPGAGASDLVSYTTRDGRTRQATRAQVANWTRGRA